MLPSPVSHIEELRTRFERELNDAAGEAALRIVRDRYLSRKGGLVSGLLKSLGSAPPDQRRELGQLANQLKQDIESRLEAKLADAARSRAPKDAIDVTLPGRDPGLGHRHPLAMLQQYVI